MPDIKNRENTREAPARRHRMSDERISHAQRLTAKLSEAALSTEKNLNRDLRPMSAKESWQRVGLACLGAVGFSLALFLIPADWKSLTGVERASSSASSSQQRSTASVLPAKPSFEYFAERDKFTGNLLQSVRNQNGDGQTVAIAKPDPDSAGLEGHLTFLLDPSTYICPGIDDEVLIEYVYVKNGVVSEPGGMRWSVTKSRKAFILPKGYYSDVLYQTSIQADEIRFRYTDRCGETKTLSFTTDGLAAAVNDLAAR